jgi:hypothetical protein
LSDTYNNGANELKQTTWGRWMDRGLQIPPKVKNLIDSLIP